MTQGAKDTMLQAEEKIEAAKPAADNLEPYRRLIDLQKQMIELVHQHERTKRECVALREQLLEEMIPPRRWWNLRQRISRLKNFATAWKSGVKNQPRPAGSSLRNLTFENPNSRQPGYDQSY
jgi:hypothetical protein